VYFIDLHTHKDELEPSTLQVRSIDFSSEDIPNGRLISAGCHPWHLNPKTLKITLPDLAERCKSDTVIAIGECGLDRVCRTDWFLQRECFLSQIELANALKKPLIIHCVRAYEEVLQCLKEAKSTTAVIFHGFNKGITLAKRLVENGHYLSFGAYLFKENAANVFNAVPGDRIFLETDGSAHSISTIYQKAAELKQTDTDVLKKIINSNFHRVFAQRTFAHHE
jgi:TatD DNase family protein